MRRLGNAWGLCGRIDAGGCYVELVVAARGWIANCPVALEPRGTGARGRRLLGCAAIAVCPRAPSPKILVIVANAVFLSWSLSASAAVPGATPLPRAFVLVDKDA
jgi:hypothetical protein